MTTPEYEQTMLVVGLTIDRWASYVYILLVFVSHDKCTQYLIFRHFSLKEETYYYVNSFNLH